MTFYLSTKPVFIPSTLPLKIVRQRSDLRRRTIFFCEPDGLQSDCDFFILAAVGNYKGRIPSEVLSPNLELKRNLSDSHK